MPLPQVGSNMAQELLFSLRFPYVIGLTRHGSSLFFALCALVSIITAQFLNVWDVPNLTKKANKAVRPWLLSIVVVFLQNPTRQNPSLPRLSPPYFLSQDHTSSPTSNSCALRRGFTFLSLLCFPSRTSACSRYISLAKSLISKPFSPYLLLFRAEPTLSFLWYWHRLHHTV